MRPLLLLFVLSLLVLCVSANTTKVGFVYGNFPNDLSWTYANDLARAFLEFSRPNVKTKYFVTQFGCDANSTDVIRSVADKDYTMIVTSSSSFESCTSEIAKSYPSKFFISLGGTSGSGNYGSVMGRMYEARWVVGVVAGMITKTKKIGYIGSIPMFQDYSDVNAAVMGMHTVCPDCKLYHYWCGGFFNPAEDEYAAQQLITVYNVDALLVLHDAFSHIPVAQKYNIPTFGIDADQSSVAPEIIVTSTYWNWGPMLLRFVDLQIVDKFPGDFIYWGIRENAIGLTAFENVNQTVIDRAQQEIATVTANEFVNGTSWIFCGARWEQHTTNVNASFNVPKCLVPSEVLSMNYFVDGVVQLGFVKVPPPVRKLKWVAWKSPAGIILSVLAAIGIVVAGVLGVSLVAVYHDTAVVKMTNRAFIIVVCLGIMFGYSIVFTYLGKFKRVSCILRPWLGGLGFALTFAPMIAKNYRLARILSNTALISTVIPTSELFGITGGLIGVELLLLILWTVIPPARLQVVAHPHSTNEALLVCRSDKQWIFIGLQLAYIVSVLVAGFVLSYLTRKVASRVLFKEARWINYEFYAAGVFFVLFALATGFLWDNYMGLLLVSCIVIILLASSATALVIGPKIYVLFWVNGGRESTSVAGTGSIGGSDFATDFKPDPYEF